MKAPGIHCYVAGSIPAVTPRYRTTKIEKCSLEHKKTKEKVCLMKYTVQLWLSMLDDEHFNVQLWFVYAR
jgi:hypothetical protein